MIKKLRAKTICLIGFAFLLSFFSYSIVISAKASPARVTIDLVYNGQVFRYIDEYIQPTNHIVAQDIKNRKINAELSDKLVQIDKCLKAGASYRDSILYTMPLLEKVVNKAINAINLKPYDSEIKFNPDQRPMFNITRERVGLQVNESKVYQDIYMRLYRKNVQSVVIAPTVVRPEKTSYDMIKQTYLRAKFSTDYSISIEDRKHNIRLALSKINGYVLLPKEEFSFNKIVGKRTEKNGFKKAKIIMAGEYTEGLGGGVCQASTTIYNCALLSDMAITSAKNHSLSSSYVSPSFDAMVTSASNDLKFINNGETPVYIKAYGDNNKAYVEFYGTKLPYQIRTESNVISTTEAPPDREIIDVDRKHVSADAAPGERVRVSYSHAGLKSEGYLLYYDYNNNLLERKLIRRDSYSSCKGLIAIAP